MAGGQPAADVAEGDRQTSTNCFLITIVKLTVHLTSNATTRIVHEMSSLGLAKEGER